MDETGQTINLPDFIAQWVDVGIFVVDRDMKIMLWNHFMARHSGRKAEDVVGRNLFECFRELPEAWLGKKLKSVFMLKNFAFTSWEQRPYLFRFPHNRPITEGGDFMFQNCTFLPVKNARGDVDSVCVTLFDATDVGLSQTLLKDALESLKESSNRDGLTGIYNRRYLEQYLSMEFDRANRYGGQFSFILFDFDHFKKINDTFGHLAGDEVLSCISRRVSAMLRTTDVLGRYGGEEFGVILSETCIEDARHFAERLRAVVSMELVSYKHLTIPVSVSIGLSQFEPGISSYEQLISNADVALYESKEMGRDRVTCFFPDGVSASGG